MRLLSADRTRSVQDVKAINDIWRLVCERVIVFFSIHERLRRIEQNTVLTGDGKKHR